MQYELIRSHRKTIAVNVIDGQLLVKAPFHTSNCFIQSIIAKRRLWIEEVILKQHQQAKTQNLLATSGRLWVKGILRELIVSESTVNGVELSEALVNLQIKSGLYRKAFEKNTLPSTIKILLEKWFAEQAKQLIYPKVEQYSHQLRLYPRAINIRQFKARWGSCDSSGKLQFNYLLIMVPEWVIDYVIVHELCHLKFLNHSKQFWQLVYQYCPDAIKAKTWLKQHQASLIWR